MKVCGIDPGKKGAICIIDTLTTDPDLLAPMPMIKAKKPEYDLPTIVKLFKVSNISHVYIEKVHAMPGQGVVSMFSFGKGYGFLIGILSALSIPYTEVAPQTWKKYCLKDMKKDKGSAIIRVKQLNPNVNLFPTERSRVEHEGMAEAYLITLYGMHQEVVNMNGITLAKQEND